MNEHYEDSFENSAEFEQTVTAKKIDILNNLLAAGHVDDRPKAVGVTELELLGVTPTSDWPALRTALEQLLTHQLIVERDDTPYDVGVFIGYELADDIPTTMRLCRSDEVMNQLNKRIATQGIASLSAEEWALRYILRVEGRDIDLVKVHRSILEDLHDEGVEKWHRAFTGAIKQAESLFRPQA